MDLLNWFICWVADNHKTLLPRELEELNILIKRIKIELQDSSDTKDRLTRSEKHQQKKSELSRTLDGGASSQDSLVNKDDEIERNATNIEAHEIFLSLVRIYLKDAKQINLSHHSSIIESFSNPGEEPQLDHGSNEKDSSVCGNQETDLQLSSDEKNFDGVNSSPETCAVPTNRSNCDAASAGRSTTSKTPESCKKLRHIRQNLKKLAHKFLKSSQNPYTNANVDFDHMLNSYRLELDAVECEGNERLTSARAELIQHADKLSTRLKAKNPPSIDESNEHPEMSSSSPLDRIEQVQRLAERINEDMKLTLFDSRTDKDFMNFDENLTDYLIQLDGIRCADDESLLAARKKVVKYIEQLIRCLDIKLLLDSFLSNNIDDPSSVTRDETLERIQQVESLIETVKYLSKTPCEYLDGNFSVDPLLNKCLVQLNYIECQDEELLNKRQDIADYVDALQMHAKFKLDLAPNFCDEQNPHCSITAKVFESIKKVEEESERLSVHIEFGSFQSRADRNFVYVEEMLTKLLINLDSVNCDGNEEVRAARKKAVQYINELAEKLEAKIPL